MILDFESFSPESIPSQREYFRILNTHDYSLGDPHILASGTVGSAKTTAWAWIALNHCIQNPKAKLMISRMALPDLKQTLYGEIRDMAEPIIKQGFVKFNDSMAYAKFANGSEIISKTFADKNFKKVRSLNLSAMIFEELTEFKDEYYEAIYESRMRLGRKPGIKGFAAYLTNPDSPSHPAYEDMISKSKPGYYIVYSNLEDNPYLPDSYKQNLLQSIPAKMADRMLRGRWIEIATDGIVYYQYEDETNYIDQDYTPKKGDTIIVSFDFNIGVGKPFSLTVSAWDGTYMRVFDEIIIEGLRTSDMLDELHDKGLLGFNLPYIITGDATGKHKDTRSRTDDVSIIRKYFENYKQGKSYINAEVRFSKSNPPIRKRHNLVNTWLKNAAGQTRIYVYKGAQTVRKGLKLTQLKKGSGFQEDDGPSHPYQHCTTTIGYACVMLERKYFKPKSKVVQ